MNVRVILAFRKTNTFVIYRILFDGGNSLTKRGVRGKDGTVEFVDQ